MSVELISLYSVSPQLSTTKLSPQFITVIDLDLEQPRLDRPIIVWAAARLSPTASENSKEQIVIE